MVCSLSPRRFTHLYGHVYCDWRDEAG